jgi:hypothetical protein
MENTKKIAKSEDMYDDLRRLKALKQSIKDERGELQKEREEIDALKDSVSYLRDLFEKKELEKSLAGAGEDMDCKSLKVHLFASTAEKNSLKEKLSKLNFLIEHSPYVFMLIDMEEQQICWSSSNLTRVLGYDLRDLRNLGFKSIFVEPNLMPVVKDGLLLNQQAVCQDGTSILVDMCFQVGEAESHEVILSFHKVSERADFK